MAGEVGIKIKVSAKDAVRNLSKLKNLSNRLQESFSRLQKRSNGTANNIRKTGLAAKTASKGVNTLNRAVRRLLVGFGVLQTAKFVLFQTSQIETQRKSLEVLTGSLEDTNRIIAEIQAFGAVTPFKSSDLIETTKRLKAFGFETEEIVDVTKRLADVAGATGADLGGIATAFGQIQAKGRLQGEELLQLQERGVSLQDELQKMYNLTSDEFRKALEGGKISADAVNLALKNITDTGGKYAGGAIAQSTTLAGKFSTLVDGVEALARTFGEVLNPVLKGVLGNAIKVLNTINETINTGKIAGGLGLTKEARRDIIEQAQKEAEEIVNLRNIANPFERNEEFLKVFAERELDLIKKFGFLTGQLQPEITPPQFDDAKVPDLLGGSGADKKGLLDALEKEQQFLVDALNKGTAKARLEEKIRNLMAEQNGLSEEAARKKLKLIEADKERVALQEKIQDILATGMTNAVMGLIEGTKTLGQALADIAKQLASMFLQSAFTKLFSGLTFGSGTSGIGPVASGSQYASMLGGAVGLYSSAGSFKAFRQGGIVTSPTMGIIGEGGESEYVIPASKMSGAMSRYSAGARGGAVIPGGSHESGTVAGSSGNAIVEYTGPVLNFNGDEYVPKSAVPDIIGAASKQGAMAGKAQTFNALKNSRSQRASLGL